MDAGPVEFGERSRLRLLLDRLSRIEDGRDPHRVAYPLAEIMLLSVCGTIADCDDYDDIADWGERHLGFLRRFAPFHHGVPCGRWLTIMMNRINPVLFSQCFSDWVRACWPDRPELVAIDGKTLRRSHDRAAGQPALHLVSAFATTRGLILGQEAVGEKGDELSAIPVLLERLGTQDGLKGALVSIDAVACNGTIAKSIRETGADYLLAVKANQPTLRRDVEALFGAAAQEVERITDVDKGHGRIEQRELAVISQVDWLDAARRFPGELRLPDVAAILQLKTRTQLKAQSRFESRYYITSSKAPLCVLADAIRGHWRIKNQLHWTLDVTFNEDQSRLRKGQGARNMAVVRHFALNLVRQADEALRPERQSLRRKTNEPPAPRKTSIKLRRKLASWDTGYLSGVLAAPVR